MRFARALIRTATVRYRVVYRRWPSPRWMWLALVAFVGLAVAAAVADGPLDPFWIGVSAVGTAYLTAAQLREHRYAEQRRRQFGPDIPPGVMLQIIDNRAALMLPMWEGLLIFFVALLVVRVLQGDLPTALSDALSTGSLVALSFCEVDHTMITPKPPRKKRRPVRARLKALTPRLRWAPAPIPA